MRSGLIVASVGMLLAFLSLLLSPVRALRFLA
jgi:predicted exporter